MNIIIIPLIILTSILISSDKIPEDIKAYGTINFGDGKQYVNSKFKENEIRKDSDTNAKIIHYKGESHKHAPFDTIKIFHESMSTFFLKHKNRFKIWHKYIFN